MNIMNVLRTGMNMSISHISVSGYGTSGVPCLSEYRNYTTWEIIFKFDC